MIVKSGRSFNFKDTFRCFSRVFQAGVDKFNRRRYCIHSILLEQSALAAIPFASPLTFGARNFLKSNVNLKEINEYSFPEIEIDDHPSFVEVELAKIGLICNLHNYVDDLISRIENQIR